MNKEFLMNLKRGLAKRVMPGVLAGTLLFGSGVSEAQATFAFEEPKQSYSDFTEYKGIKIFVNGRYVEFNDDMGYPIAINGRTYIPVRAVSETFNSYVYYSDLEQTVFISKHGMQIEIKLGESYINKLDLANNSHELERIEMDAKAFAQNNRTYIPIRALFEGFGMNVTWDGENQTVYVADDYEKNTEYIDFKNYKVIDIKDIDLNKKYSKIMYDGVEIDKDYVNILKNSLHYKVIEDKDTLNIFSYQYLFDLNYLYEALTKRKNNTTKEKELYTLWSISEEEYMFLKQVSFIDDRFSYIFSTENDLTYSGKVYHIESATHPEEYIEIDKVVDEIVNRVNATAKTDEEKVRMVNDEMCKIMEYGFKKGDGKYSPIYTSLVYPNYGYCGEYAITFKYLMDKLGINCIIVNGTNMRSKGPHAWNEVLINGEWKIVDVSSNDYNNINYILLVDYNEVDYFVTSKEEKDYEQLVKYTLKLNNAN